MKTRKFLALLLVFALLITGCSKPDEQEEETSTEETTTEAEPMPYPVVINNTEIPFKPEKVVCLSPAMTEIIYELGYGDTIIGRSSYCVYPDEITKVKDVGSAANPKINDITDLMPNLVITSTPIASKDIFTMEQAGIATVVIPAPTSLEGFSSIYTALGVIYEGMFTGTETGEAAYSNISKLLGNTDAVNIGSFIYVTEGLAVAGGDTFESAVLSCFGTNIAKSGTGYGYDKEQLAENQPEIVLVNAKYTRDMLLEDEILGQLDAVQNNMIIYIDNIFFERPTARISMLVNNLLADYRGLTQ